MTRICRNLNQSALRDLDSTPDVEAARLAYETVGLVLRAATAAGPGPRHARRGGGTWQYTERRTSQQVTTSRMMAHQSTTTQSQ